jgi:hypothetical protein
MILQRKSDMYDRNDFLNFIDVNNKLFCTFVTLEEIDNFVKEISHKYVIMYNKLFVLYIKDTNEYVVTYNTDQINLSSIPDNTILVHRKKETNTLYTINALNDLIKKLNGGVVDVHYRINWQHYKNTILLTQHNELKQLKTKIHNIIEL